MKAMKRRFTNLSAVAGHFNGGKLLQTLRDYFAARDEKLAADERMKEKQATLFDLMKRKGLAGLTDGSGEGVTFTNSESKRFDTKAFQKAYPQMYRNFCVKSHAESFRYTSTVSEDSVSANVQELRNVIDDPGFGKVVKSVQTFDLPEGDLLVILIY